MRRFATASPTTSSPVSSPRNHSIYVAFEQELDRCLVYELPLSVLMMDLDRFKSVNDTHGHLMGSHVLAEVGGIIRHCIRSIGVSTAPEHGTTIKELVGKADKALYRAKERGRNRVCMA